MQHAVFLDRDNTLIANDGDLGDPDRVQVIDGVAAGLRSLRDAGYRLIVVTNQGGVARGKYSEQDVDAVNQRIAELIDREAGANGLIDRFYYCPYHPDATVEEYRRDHPWRKPQAGMLLQAARDLELDLEQCWLIGDQLRDIQAGRTAGCRTVLVGADESLIEQAKPTAAAATFSESVALVLGASPQKAGRIPWPHSRPASSSAATDDAAEIEAHGQKSSSSDQSDASMRRAVNELAEELRVGRLQRNEFTPMKLFAWMSQLMVLLLVLLGLLQLQQTDVFLKWMAAAILMQLFTLTLFLADSR